jgi:hypothetical protein
MWTPNDEVPSILHTLTALNLVDVKFSVCKQKNLCTHLTGDWNSQPCE